MILQSLSLHKPTMLAGVILCSVMLMFTSCDDAPLNEAATDANSSAEPVATAASGKQLKVADAATAQPVYWTGQKARSGESIIGRSYINESGSPATEIIYRGNQLGNPYGVAIDLEQEQLYWTDISGGFIARSALDGSGSVDTLYSAGDGVSSPTYISADFVNNTLLWTDQNTIYKGSLDGSDSVETVYTSENGLNLSYGIDLLLLGDLLYWTELADNEIVVGRTQGDINPQVLFEASDARPALTSLLDLEIDLLSGRLYVSDSFSETSSRILRGSLAGGDSLQTLYGGPEDFVAASSLTIDHVHRELYWSQTSGADFSGTILRGSLDGSIAPELVYDLRNFEGEGIAQLYSIAIPGPLGLKSKSVQEGQQDNAVYLHF